MGISRFGFFTTENKENLSRTHVIIYIRQNPVAIKCYPETPVYAGLRGEGHGGYRVVAPYVTRADIIKHLPIKKNVKMFRVRPQYKAGSPAITDLIYDNNLERLRYWTAISCGSTSGGNPDTGEANTNNVFHSYTNLDNTAFIDNLDQADGSYNPTDGVSSGTRKCEVGWMVYGQPITFTNFALIEFIIDKIHAIKGHFEVKMSAQPTAVYYASCRTSTASPVSLFKSLSFTYADGVLSADLSGADIEQYDKIRIAINLSGDFTLAEPSFSDYDGDDKILGNELNCERKYGNELNPKTSCEDGWTLSGNVSVKSLPSVIADYTTYNSVKSHLEFKDNSATATKAITITQPCRRVAVRIVCQSFMPIATTRYSSNTDVMNSGYVSTSNQIKNGDFDYGTIKLIINSNIIRKNIVMQGWSEVYFEVDVEPDTTSLSLQIARDNFVDTSYMNSDRPMFVHDVSVQKIE
jgi:hypothetical protein